MSALVLSLVVSAAGTDGPGSGSSAAAQAPDPCALLPVDDVQPLANTTVAEGVSSSSQSFGSMTCRYTWGTGVDRFRLDIIVNDASRMFPGKSPAQMIQQLQAPVAFGTVVEVIADVGDAAVFTSESPIIATTTAHVKGRILQVQLDGLFARDKKDEMVALLKSAAGRL